MKQKSKKGSIILIMTAVMILLLSACGKNNPETLTTKNSKDYIYKMATLPVSDEINNINAMFHAGDKTYVYGNDWDSDKEESKIIFCEINDEGTALQKTILNVPRNVSYNNFIGDSKGNIYSIKNEYIEMDSDSADSYSRENYYLIQMDLQGNELWSVCLNEIADLKTEDYFYAGSLLCTKEDKLLINAMGQYAFFDIQGQYQGLLKLTGEGADQIKDYSANLMELKNGKFIFNYYDEKGMVMREVNLETGVLSDVIQFPENFNYYSFFPAIGYDLFLVDSNNVYGYNLGEQNPVKLMNFVDSDLAIFNISNLEGISETEFMGFIDDVLLGKRLLARFTKVDPKDITDKTDLTLGGIYVDWSIKSAVVDFNKTNEKYRIHIADYQSTYKTPDEYLSGSTKLNTDIVSGNIPDILILSNEMPVENYIAKGLFADIKLFIEKDEELNIENFMPNIMEAYSANGHLYQLVPSYNVSTVLAKTSLVGNKQGWTLKEAQALLDSMPEGTMLFPDTVRDNIMFNSMNMGGNQFVDWTEGKCNYNSQAFIDLLEFAARYPKDYEQAFYDRSIDYESMWRSDKALAMNYNLGSFRDFNYIVKATFGEDVTMIGFPSESGMGTSIQANMAFAMSAKSKKQEGAWEFLRYFLTDEYQKTISYGWPLSISRLDELAAEATRKPFYEDETGAKVEYDDYYYLGEMQIPLEPMTEKQVDDLKKILYSLDQVAVYNVGLQNIITEEAESFFEGQKSARDVAEIIQSRAQIYVSENR